MNGREIEVIFAGVYHLPEAYRMALAQAMSWEAICYLLNGLSINLSQLVELEEGVHKGLG